MLKISEKKLIDIKGGGSNSLSGTIINALVDIIKLVKDAGYDIGSGLRRIIEGNICPFE